MNAAQSPGPIREVNPRTDLLPVADLIELCFAATLDEDGRGYLRHLRGAARPMVPAWARSATESMMPPLQGFVWEEDGQVIGNLSLIPILRSGKLYYLIANVAVHPSERRRGIGRRLTEAALHSLAARGVTSAWLQVRDDNRAAYQLYHSLGFIERGCRTTWVSDETTAPVYRGEVPGVSLHYRRRADWPLQRQWLIQNYPPELEWNLAIDIPRLSVNRWQVVLRFLRSEVQEHWTARTQNGLLGVLSWEPMRGSSDALWLAAPRESEEQAAQVLLPYARQALARRHRRLSLNYPAGRAREAFLQANFVPHQTLIWMSINLQAQFRADPDRW